MARILQKAISLEPRLNLCTVILIRMLKTVQALRKRAIPILHHPMLRKYLEIATN